MNSPFKTIMALNDLISTESRNIPLPRLRDEGIEFLKGGFECFIKTFFQKN